MKRLHINVKVKDIEESERFYSALFAADPTVRKTDYARWMLDDPRVNFAISHCGSTAGINHLGIQAEESEELADVYERIEKAGGASLDEGETTCCYSRSTKQWIADPQGVVWEAFQTHGDAGRAGDRAGDNAPQTRSRCC